jgi:glycosyltransferase involved in cell wall biosynthesis
MAVVSIIIPTYNRRATLERALQSIYAQTYDDYEIIVVDDASTDGTAAWLQADPRLKVIVLPSNRGAAAARNVGIAAAQGDLMAFLDSDDEWVYDYLEKQVQALAVEPEAVLSYTKYFSAIAGNGGWGQRVESWPLDRNDLVRAMLLGNFIHSLSLVVVPRWALAQAGCFDERLLICHDREFYLRVFAIGFPIYVNEPLVTKFWQPDSLVAHDRCETWLTDGLRLLEIFYGNPANSRYWALRPEAELRFRDRVQLARPFFARVADRNPR